MNDDREDRDNVRGRDLAAEYKEIVDRLAEAPGVEAIVQIYNDLMEPFAVGQSFLRALEPEPLFINTDTTR